MHYITIQNVVTSAFVPSITQLKKWAKSALQEIPAAELTIRLVEEDEMTTLNSAYRKKNKPTNVLSFPFDMPMPPQRKTRVLGDIIICAPVIHAEASEQQKNLQAHWAHMVIHGTLHLLGYDHENDHDAAIMEKKEIALLATLHFDNPYDTIT